MRIVVEINGVVRVNALILSMMVNLAEDLFLLNFKGDASQLPNAYKRIPVFPISRVSVGRNARKIPIVLHRWSFATGAIFGSKSRIIAVMTECV